MTIISYHWDIRHIAPSYLVFNFAIVKIDTGKTGMMNLDPVSMKKVLLTQIQSVEARFE